MCLGMKIDNNRPPFDFDGAWLALNERPVVHIIVNEEHSNSSHKPTLDHVAFRANNIESIKKRLDRYDISYEEKITPDNQVHQIFIVDPNGIKIELSKLISFSLDKRHLRGPFNFIYLTSRLMRLFELL